MQVDATYMKASLAAIAMTKPLPSRSASTHRARHEHIIPLHGKTRQLKRRRKAPQRRLDRACRDGLTAG